MVNSMARPTPGEAEANAVTDVIEPPAGLAKRVKDAIVSCECPTQPRPVVSHPRRVDARFLHTLKDRIGGRRR